MVVHQNRNTCTATHTRTVTCRLQTILAIRQLERGGGGRGGGSVLVSYKNYVKGQTRKVYPYALMDDVYLIQG